MKTAIMRSRAFPERGLMTIEVMLDEDGEILVLDSWSGHWTKDHVLSKSAIRRARKLLSQDD